MLKFELSSEHVRKTFINQPMFDHITLNVADFSKSKAFYEKALAPFGYKAVAGEDGAYCGFGTDRPTFWISQSGEGYPVSRGAHVALSAKSRTVVDAFHEAAIAAGGVDNGKPGRRPEYGAQYYAAFVRDLDGNNIEAVTFET